jgi:hypothetical protein
MVSVMATAKLPWTNGHLTHTPLPTQNTIPSYLEGSEELNAGKKNLRLFLEYVVSAKVRLGWVMLG